ncbi:MAG TPA: response regulator [Methylophilus sp.]|uniref:response regulator n=1 Tax=Methylophilus sp. TaxID=29541 RepID=UPI002B51A8F3|nr:response regulator [Methylophilus sp.]HSH87196.1 response regulator [Methylophilus sp.]
MTIPDINKGSTCSQDLKPVESPQHEIKSAVVEHAAQDLPKEKNRVLVIDDNEDAASTLSDLLALAGNDVKTANSGKQGLKTAEEFQPNIIFLDIGLPDITGYEVARAIRQSEKLSKCYLIALTGYGTESDRQTALAAGFDLHVTKPLDYEKIESISLGL